MPDVLHGAIAAAVTPLRDGGRALDLDAVAPLVAFLATHGIDGALTCGTTGEGILLSPDERVLVSRAFVAARPDGFQVAVHAGAQTTADTVMLSADARDSGADAVAVIAPPYFPLDVDELFLHFLAAADACDPLPFYAYEFAGRSGYPIPLPVIDRLRSAAPNFTGLKVSDKPFESVKPYLIESLDVFIGSEPLVLEGMANGAVGSVSGLATAFPEVVARLVHDRDEEAHERVTALRDGLEGIPFHAGLKDVLVERGILTTDDVRAPLRALTKDERSRMARLGAA
jgi:dihydrodipicolinate synthase/N-acetylneuraminate lyase